MLPRKAAQCAEKAAAGCSARGDGEQPWQAGVLPRCGFRQQPGKAQAEG